MVMIEGKGAQTTTAKDQSKGAQGEQVQYKRNLRAR